MTSPSLPPDVIATRPTRKVFRPRVLPSLFVVAALALFLSLGSWQTRRYREQTAAAELYHTQHDVLAPVTTLVDPAPDRLHHLNFRRATLTGTLDTAHLNLLTARYMLGKLGYAVIVPLELADQPGRPLLVHLGWASAEKIAGYLAELRAHPQRTVSGRLQLPEARAPDEPPVGEHLGVPTWLHPNPRALATRVPGLDPDLMLQAGKQAVGDTIDPEKVPLDGYMYPIHPLPTKNIEYAATWFGLAATVVAVWVAFSLREVA
jgi:surfeit locus 1 family protein